MTHTRAIAESGLRLRRDLLDDLLAGDDGGAFACAEALGYDLHDQHWVVVVRSDTISTDALLRAFERTAADLEMPTLLGPRFGTVVLVIKLPDVALVDPRQRFHRVLANRLGTAVGVGGQADAPDGLARSFDEATRTMAIRASSRTTDGVAVFDELGIYRLIAPGDRTDEIERFIQHWIGPLLDYDATHGADVVRILSAYLEREVATICRGGAHRPPQHRALPPPAHPRTHRRRSDRPRQPVQPAGGDACLADDQRSDVSRLRCSPHDDASRACMWRSVIVAS